ncbi:hypothetical protein F4777DRAFT_594805 [Nemania sp. FL0916]|nr:hypothetical protein F4777DRAFT_594805 [Nemania sp. FL0916]
MDPLTAFGVAANVVAFVDFSWKLFSSAREIYTTREGVSGDVRFLDIIVREIDLYRRNLGIVFRHIDTPLQNIVDDARYLAVKLSSITDSLTRTKASRWKSFAIALKGALKQPEINALITQLESLQKRIADHVQLITFNGVSDLSMKIADMEKANARLGLEWQKELAMLNQGLEVAVQSVIDGINGELRKAMKERMSSKIKIGQPVQPSAIESLSQDLQNFKYALTNFQDQGKIMASDQRVLESLYFDGIRARHRTIDRAHKKTFEWIFSPTETSKIPFDKWLKGDGEPFFIYGKPGSGKCRNLIPLAKETIGDIEEFESDQGRWTKEQLLETYQALVANDASTRFCFFIDGLDEYHDSNRRAEELIQTLRSLQYSPNIKLCVSSRPWPAFTEAFGDSQWVLKLEDLTRNDIIKYVSDKFNASTQYRRLTLENPEYESLVNEVAAHANGVFLWVVLVIRNLSEGFMNNDSVHLMRERLDSFPKDLELFFEHMLNSVSQIYLRHMTRTFQTAVSSRRPLLLMFYSFLDDAVEDTENLNRRNQNALSPSEIKSRQDRMCRQLYGRTKGLLEVVTDEKETHPFFQLRVDFLHRTVRDFLRESGNVGELFENSIQHDRISTSFLVCRTIVNQIKMAMDLIGFREQELLEFRDEKRPAPPNAVEDLLDTAEDTYKQAIFHYKWAARTSGSIFLGLAAQYDFQAYMMRKMKIPNSRSKLNRQVGRPVLDYALVPASGQNHIECSAAMVGLLLDAGADANQPYKGSTIWLRFVTALGSGRIEADRMIVVRIINALVSHKAAMDQETIAKLKRALSPDEQSLILGLSRKPRYMRKAWQGFKQRLS